MWRWCAFGDLEEFLFFPSGDNWHLKSVQAPKVLHLKIGCPVILTTNVSSELVNGTRGCLIGADDNMLTVRTDQGGIVKLDRFVFSRHDPATMKPVASRKQFPVAPAFALTFHKCQGVFSFINILHRSTHADKNFLNM